MYVCICHAVTDRDIHQAVDTGASSVEMICDRLNVSTNCGQCLERAREVFDEAIAQGNTAMEATAMARKNQACPLPCYSDRRQVS
ncbi:(2Fe-2S)-binding protein [Roseofilum casamattae]|uniref:Bacterioferritin-associated ferredoxin n=1 Tax=Roseofilum casamattae BLCC-M143 TaxID=3022442 RepID=A0ABT7BZW7_9CYAN|nr:(2Fe-2S)-binding protein [Roseofilum casamattae]MDJ1183981.1 (2Fe-2S)-binding protein [Roseofilum casamattae BLCC-M143]